MTFLLSFGLKITYFISTRVDEAETGETRVPRENLSVQRREPTNSTDMTPDLGIEPGPHWWEVSALTTAPSLHPL